MSPGVYKSIDDVYGGGPNSMAITSILRIERQWRLKLLVHEVMISALSALQQVALTTHFLSKTNANSLIFKLFHFRLYLSMANRDLSQN